MSTWREQLKITDEDQLLDVFAWFNDDELRAARTFPEFMVCDIAFGVTKEQRKLFMFAGIDGNNKVFTAFHFYMPSKEARLYH